MKELLKITEVKDSICSVEINAENEADIDKIAAGILTIMKMNESLAKKIAKVVYLYITKREEVTIVCEEAKRLATVKLKN